MRSPCLSICVFQSPCSYCWANFNQMKYRADQLKDLKLCFVKMHSCVERDTTGTLCKDVVGVERL